MEIVGNDGFMFDENSTYPPIPSRGEIWTTYDDIYCKIVCVANKLSKHKEEIVCYSKCDEKGIFISIRDKDGNITKQPFWIELEVFTSLWEKFK